MGAGPSKTTASSGEHIFKGTAPVSFSQQIVDGLQTSPETDRSRTSDTELHIQQRVQTELKRLEKEQNQRIAELQDLLKEKDPQSAPSSSSTSSSTVKSTAAGLKDKIQQSAAPLTSALTGQPRDHRKELDRDGVQKEIDSLRSKLSKRKLKEDVVNDKKVEKTRTELVECLRLHDRKPLDCWKEAENFRKEVGRLEGQFLGNLLD